MHIDLCFLLIFFSCRNNGITWFVFVARLFKYEHWNEGYWEVLSCGTVYYAVQDGSNFWVWE